MAFATRPARSAYGPAPERFIIGSASTDPNSVPMMPGSMTPAMNTLETVLFESGRPILVAPPTPPEHVGTNVVIGWNGGTESAIDTGKDKDEEWHTFEIEVDEAGSTATFYIDGERITTQPTATPTSASATGLMPLQFVRIAGSGTKSAEIDYYKYQITPTSVGDMFPE